MEHPEEARFKHQFLDKNPSRILQEIGVRKGQVVLDYGCGAGTYTIPAAKLVGDGGLVYALDVNSSFLDRLEERARLEGLDNIVRIDASGKEKIPLEDEKVDVILLIDVLHLIGDREALFDEACRILKHGGLIVVYPMHITESEVKKLATRRNLFPEEELYERRILTFSKLSK